MAAACHRVSDKAHGTSSNADEDEQLLEETAVVAVMFIGNYSIDIVLQAARKVKSERKRLTAENLQQAVDDFMMCKTQASCMQSPVSKRKHHHHKDLGSDGEENESLPNIDHDEPQKMDVDDDGDIQTDGEAASSFRQPLYQCESEMAHKPSRELGPAVQCMAMEKNNSAANMKMRLKVLKSENRRLKERSMCKQCHSKPLSITFLPCGHYSYCYECGQAFSACPICKRTILADVRTFLA